MKLENKSYKWVKCWTAVYMAVMFLVFPLYFQNNYINMLEAKTALFVPATCIYVAGGVLWILAGFLSGCGTDDAGKNRKYSKSKMTVPAIGRPQLLLQDVFFLVFLIAVVLSVVLADNFYNAWNAPECKMFGAKIILLCCGIYVISSRGVAAGKVIKYAFAAGMFAVFTLTVLNRYGIDPLGMYSNLVEYQKHKYMSTIGNANILSNFICIFIPLIMGIYMYAEGKASKIIYAVLLYTGIMAGVATNSDSFFLGFGASVIFFLWFAMDSKEKLTEYLCVGVIGSVAMFSLKLFNDLSSYSYKWNSLQLDLIYNIPWLILAVALGVIIVFLTKIDRVLPMSKIRNIIFILLGAGLIVFVLFIIRVNTGSAVLDSGYLTFNDEWGTNRGFVWTRTCQLFGELPFYQQLTGIGPGEFRDFFASFNVERAAMGLPDFADPHSEFLYYLVATGVVGVIGYFGMIIAAIIKCLKIRTDNLIILAAIFVSWLAQGLVNNPLVFVTPYIFLFLGMSRSEMRKKLQTK